jgi:hypothetical protein
MQGYAGTGGKSGRYFRVAGVIKAWNVLDGLVSLPPSTMPRYCGYVLGLTSSRTEVSTHMPEWPNSFPYARDSSSNMLASTQDE